MNKKSILPILVAGVLVSINLTCKQESRVPEYKLYSLKHDSPTHFFDKPGEYLEWQTENILDIVNEALLRYKPDITEPFGRQMAILLLDAVFHDEEAPNRPAVHKFHHRRIMNSLIEMDKTRVNEGAFIWKLYNMGVVIRTKSVTVGFDLTRGYSSGSGEFALPDSVMHEIVNQCDILFISHAHGDHVDEWVIQTFLDSGKPVIANTEILESGHLFEKITHLDREAHKIQYVPVQSGKSRLEVAVYPGHQGKLLNNVVLIRTPDGLSFCHTGDQSSQEDFDWIDAVGDHFEIDILIPNCWTTDPSRTAKGYDPELIIPAHENELGHSIDHREAYALDYSRWNVPYPKLIMAWGESYHYIP